MSNDHSGIDLDSLLANEEFIERLADEVAERLGARQMKKASAIKEAAEAFRQFGHGVREPER